MKILQWINYNVLLMEGDWFHSNLLRYFIWYFKRPIFLAKSQTVDGSCSRSLGIISVRGEDLC